MDYQKWLETKILRINKNVENFPNEMKQDLQRQASRYNLEVFSYNKNHYIFSAILKDKLDDRYVFLVSNDLSCFENKNYKKIEIRIMRNAKMVDRSKTIYSDWNNIGKNAREIIEWNKNIELERKSKGQNNELDIEK